MKERISYIFLLLSIGVILYAGLETHDSYRYDFYNQLAWVLIYIFGAYYSRKPFLSLLFVGLSILATVEFWDEWRGKNTYLNMWEYCLPILMLAWLYISYTEGRKVLNKIKRHDKS